MPEQVLEPQGFAALLHFFAMGGHALYVWLSYGAGVVLVFWHVWSIRRRERDWVQQARAQLKRSAVSAENSGDRNVSQQSGVRSR
ncbi:MAG: heme exporter protein CcmD [Pseudomonadales bacterium]|jgi:heme exporter protein CcmD